MPEYEELTPKEFEEKVQAESANKRGTAFSPILFQSALCALALLLLYILKLVLPDVYNGFRSWYDDEMERLVLIEYDDRIYPV